MSRSYFLHVCTILGYAYEADYHCVGCTRERFALPDMPASDTDINDIPLAATDGEGNPVHPIFASEAEETMHCGDCGGLIYDV